MTKSPLLMISFALVSIAAVASFSAMAEETNKKPAPKAQAAQPKGPGAGTARLAIGAYQSPGTAPHGAVGPGHATGGPRGTAAGAGPHLAHDRSHWGDRERRAWAGGHWRPYECRFGRCGYWWRADRYWYFYDHPMDGPPDVVSDIEYADPSTAGAPPPPDAVPVPVPAPVVIQRPPLCVGPLCL
jgi:hypothetical protein